ncbi:high-affinity choline uptake protein BetT [Vibrio astriarenae]|nr:high-affinity choline uptake protein BetT [Vibrio sp. C7]
MPQKVFWCLSFGGVVVTLILGGGMNALQAMTVSTGFPFAIVMLIAVVSVLKGLRSEHDSSKRGGAIRQAREQIFKNS